MKSLCYWGYWGLLKIRGKRQHVANEVWFKSPLPPEKFDGHVVMSSSSIGESLMVPTVLVIERKMPSKGKRGHFSSYAGQRRSNCHQTGVLLKSIQKVRYPLWREYEKYKTLITSLKKKSYHFKQKAEEVERNVRGVIMVQHLILELWNPWLELKHKNQLYFHLFCQFLCCQPLTIPL